MDICSIYVSREGTLDEQPGVVVVFETAGGEDSTPPVSTPLTPPEGGFVSNSRPGVVDGADVTGNAAISAEGVNWAAVEPAGPIVTGNVDGSTAEPAITNALIITSASIPATLSSWRTHGQDASRRSIRFAS